jgi:hypothetical protein
MPCISHHLNSIIEILPGEAHYDVVFFIALLTFIVQDRVFKCPNYHNASQDLTWGFN